mmetsp:Transcript_51905/g.59247  ORF Transcript_51905/g.59247 Transcript_51905/m.59247 type:complete len:134 (-) Transcript_51905:1791-2192(-)
MNQAITEMKKHQISTLTCIWQDLNYFKVKISSYSRRKFSSYQLEVSLLNPLQMNFYQFHRPEEARPTGKRTNKEFRGIFTLQPIDPRCFSVLANFLPSFFFLGKGELTSRKYLNARCLRLRKNVQTWEIGEYQ